VVLKLDEIQLIYVSENIQPVGLPTFSGRKEVAMQIRKLARSASITLAVIVILACNSTGDDEEGLIAIVKTTTRLSASPTSGKPVQLLNKGSKVTILPNTTSGDFVYAGLANGLEGWVRSADLSLAGSETVSLFEATEGVACAKSLEECPSQGCTPDPAHKIDVLLNETKNRELNDSLPVEIGWGAVHELQEYVDHTLKFHTGFGTSLTRQQRLKLRKIHTSSGIIGEGSLVSIEGFITATVSHSSPNPHSGGTESCNCNLAGDTEVDWHANIGPQPSSDEYEGILIEITPRHRMQDWSLVRLEGVAEKRAKIRVTGQLMFDNVHKIRRTFEENKRGNSARFSVWEIHPVSSIVLE